MSDQATAISATAAQHENRRKSTLSETTAKGLGAAGGAATVFYLLGCLKGGQLYYPDDALVYFWLGLLAPAAHVLYRRFNRWAGVEEA